MKLFLNVELFCLLRSIIKIITYANLHLKHKRLGK